MIYLLEKIVGLILKALLVLLVLVAVAWIYADHKKTGIWPEPEIPRSPALK